MSARIEAPPEGQTGPTWLRIDANGSGPLMSIPLSTDGEGGWVFETQNDTFSARGSLATDSAGNLSVSLDGGSLGVLPLAESTVSLGAR